MTVKPKSLRGWGAVENLAARGLHSFVTDGRRTWSFTCCVMGDSKWRGSSQLDCSLSTGCCCRYRNLSFRQRVWYRRGAFGILSWVTRCVFTVFVVRRYLGVLVLRVYKTASVRSFRAQRVPLHIFLSSFTLLTVNRSSNDLVE